MDARSVKVGGLAMLSAAVIVGCGGLSPVARDSKGVGEAGAVVRQAAAGHCGRERWDVKTLTDPASSQVDPTPKPSTVDQLASSAPSPDPYAPDMPRQAPERQTYTVRATLIEARLEADSDFHLVLRDADGKTMVAEIPDPACAANSTAYDQIARARATFTSTFGQPAAYPQPSMQIGRPVTVTGVLFYDAYSSGHAPTGAAPVGAGEAVELHPVIAIQGG